MPSSKARSRSGWILGLNPGFGGFNYHDPSASLVRDGEIVCAAEEERFTRRRAASGDFPAHAVQWCLRYAGIRLDEVSEIAIGYSPGRWQQRLGMELARVASNSRFQSVYERGRKGVPSDRRTATQAITQTAASLTEILNRSESWRDDATAAARIWQHLGLSRSPVPIRFVEHHMAHVASTWMPSGFRDATVVIIDGVGEVTCASAWAITDGDFGTLRLLREIFVPNSLGYLYAAMTEYLGFGAWAGEGKLMALAPYGASDPRILDALSSVARLDGDGYDVGDFVLSNLGDGLSLDLQRVCVSLAGAFGEAPRGPGEPIGDFHRNVAWATQDFLERAVVGLTTRAIAESGIANVCVAGGVFLNCKLNMVLRETVGCGRFYVQPVSKDSGLAIGSAWYRHLLADSTSRRPLLTLAVGPQLDDLEIERQLALWDLEWEEAEDLTRQVAALLADGAIVAWFEGRAEYGPRALGQRSILADPRDPAMRERLNANVKNRELWRPFGPSILQEYAPAILEGFDTDSAAPFMVEAYRVRPEWRDRIPAALHPVDGTTRPQTVRADVNREYHRLIEAFRAMTGVPAVLNTSLNDRGEPIVHSVRDAVRLFYTSGLDAMALGGKLIRKKTSRGAEQCRERSVTTLQAQSRS